MLETIDDYLSLASLILLNFFACRLLMDALFNFKQNTSFHKLWKALAEYSNNEDE